MNKKPKKSVGKLKIIWKCGNLAVRNFKYKQSQTKNPKSQTKNPEDKNMEMVKEKKNEAQNKHDWFFHS